MLNRLETLRIFCAAAEARNFKEAATRLAISPQAVTRAVKELEAQLGELLFHRNTRHSRITEFGERFALDARAGVRQVDQLFARDVPETGGELSGLVRITAPRALGQGCLVPALARLGSAHPGLRLDLRLSDLLADVVEEQVDVGVRIGFLRDSRFVARAVARVGFHMVGAPSLIARLGAPHSLEELARAPVTVVIDPNTGKPWPWHMAQGQQWSPANPVFASDDTWAECAAVVAGLGFGQIASFAAIPHLRSGALVPILPDFAPDPWELYIYRPQRGPVAARIRLVFDHLLAVFSDPGVFPQD